MDVLYELYIFASYRRILKAIHEGGSIWNNPDRKEAYNIVAKLASEHWTGVLKDVGDNQVARQGSTVPSPAVVAQQGL